MDTKLSKFLKNYYMDGAFHTHVSMFEPKGKFQFNREQLSKLWDIYDSNMISGLAEKNQHYLPILVDFDIKIEKTDDVEFFDGDLYSGHIYSREHIKEVINIYQSVLRNIVEGCDDDKLICVVLEKPIYETTKNGITYYKNGFHLTWPNIFLSKTDQDVHLTPRIKDSLTDMQIFEDIGIDDSSSLLDSNICKVPWLLYGSRKSKDMEPYLVTRVVNVNGEDLDLEEAFKNYQIYDERERLININGKVEKYLPRILSIIPYGRRIYELKYGLMSPLKEKEKNRNGSVFKNTKISVEDALQKSKILLPMLSQFRTMDRNEWMTVGWILYNIGEGCQEALEQWLEFSARDNNDYNEDECIDAWGKMIKKDLGLGTLKFYAKTDNEQLYMDFVNEEGKKYVKESLDGSHNDVAKLLYNNYCTEFVCASIANKTWYQFTGHVWEEIEEGIFLRERISDEVVIKYGEAGGELFKDSARADKADTGSIQNQIKQIQKIIVNLKNSSYKTSVMKEAAEVFYNKNFKQKLDTNPYLIAFKNGVYDLKLNIFRSGRPEDYLSKRMPIDYVEFSQSDSRVLQVYDFLEKVFPDKSVRQYFMDQSSDIFVGGNHQKIVLFYLGEGDNGKSVTQSIFEKMLGELAIKFSTTLITGKKGAMGSAAPELARAGGGVRWAVLEEPDGDEEINVGILKSLSGNDSYWARDLFEKGKSTREITPMFKLIFIANKLPGMKYADKATWNRIRVIPFESTFVKPGEPCPLTYEEQLREKRFPMDTEFGKKIPSLLSPFAWVLLEHRKTIKTRIEPEKVKMATAQYRKQNDIYRQFVEECIIDDKSSSISLIELYANFKEWFKETFPGRVLPNKNDVKDYFTKLWDEPEVGLKWNGFRIRTLQDDVEEGSVLILGDDDLADYSPPL